MPGVFLPRDGLRHPRVSGLDWHHLHAATGTTLPDTTQTANDITTLLARTADMINDATDFFPAGGGFMHRQR